MQTLSAFRRDHEHLSRDTFIDVVTEPHLTVAFMDDPDVADPEVDTDALRQSGKETLNLAGYEESDEKGPIYVMPLSFDENGGVILGRGLESPVRIPHPLVSKVHARLEIDPDGDYFLVDEDSRNGTAIGFGILSPGVKRAISPPVTFMLAGLVSCTIHTASSLYDMAFESTSENPV